MEMFEVNKNSLILLCANVLFVFFKKVLKCEFHKENVFYVIINVFVEEDLLYPSRCWART